MTSRCAVLLSWLLAIAWLPEAAAAELRDIPVPRTTLYPGDAIGPDAVVLKRFRMPEAAEARFVVDGSQLSGKFARRTLVAGKPIAINALRNAEVIRKGQPAIALYLEDGLTITLPLTPLKSAEAGDIVDTRNPETGQVVSARAQADGTLLVEAP